jgi:hypothetical protein
VERASSTFQEKACIDLQFDWDGRWDRVLDEGEIQRTGLRNLEHILKNCGTAAVRSIATQLAALPTSLDDLAPRLHDAAEAIREDLEGLASEGTFWLNHTADMGPVMTAVSAELRRVAEGCLRRFDRDTRLLGVPHPPAAFSAANVSGDDQIIVPPTTPGAHVMIEPAGQTAGINADTHTGQGSESRQRGREGFLAANVAGKKTRRTVDRSIGSVEAVEAVLDYIAAKGLTETSFGNQFQTHERTVRNFIRTGRMRRANFAAMATCIGVSVEDLLAGQLPTSVKRPNRS